MKHSLQPLHAALAALGPPTRFALVVELMARERCVTELARAVGRSHSCTTRHLQELGRAGVVRGRRTGKRVVFALAPRGPEIAALLETIAAGASGADAGEAWPEVAQPGGELTHRDRARGAPAPAKETTPTPAGGSVTDDRETNHPAPVARSNDLEDYLL